MSSPHHDSPLSRAISEIDLNAALRTVKAQADSGLRYTKDHLKKLRTGTEKNPIDHIEHVEIHRPDAGIVTPPYLIVPDVPPPTPATPIFTAPATVHTVNTSTDPAADAAVADPTFDPAAEIAAAVPKPEVEKVKKKKKSSGANKKGPVSGFEEFYCDPPITPDEAAEEDEEYGDLVPFEARIEYCIQKYRSRRKLNDVRSNIFTKFLILGGIDANPKQFTGGLDSETTQQGTSQEIADIKAQDYVGGPGPFADTNAKFYDKSDKWVVDFEGVAKGFFSYRVPRMFPIDNQEQVKEYCAVIRNFLSYMLLHGVCREWTAVIMAAKRICDLAEKELWSIKQATAMLPGDFNISASTLFGGYHEKVRVIDQSWAVDADWEEFGSNKKGFSIPEAQRVFMTGVAVCGEDLPNEFDDDFLNPLTRISKTQIKSYEVVEIDRATADTIAMYSKTKNIHGEIGLLKPLGVLKVKYWEGTKIQEEDASDDEAAEALMHDGVESFFLEDQILELLSIGLKMQVVIAELSCGFKFIDNITGLYCSFFTYLPNEKMVYWKEPVPNERPPPTVDDPEAEETAQMVELDREV